MSNYPPIGDSIFADLPPFCTPVPKPDDPLLATWLDGWNVWPSGDENTDFEMGRDFADIAVRYARAKHEPAWIGFVIATIHWKALNGLLTPSWIEQGFFARLAQLAYVGSLN